MVQESNMQFIPEELYNLTQLAEVTLAAGPLSTTNVNTITEYINKEKTKHSSNMEKDDEITDCRKLKFRKKLHTMTNNNSNNGNVDKINQKLESNFNKSNLSNSKIYHSAVVSNVIQSVNSFQNEKNDRIEHNIHSFSSSDDDSNYYSHKIFDRKKSRRSTISDNSRYDEHSCSSSVPSSGEEHFSNHSSLTKQSISHTMSLDDDHICPECGKKYSTSSNLARHRQTHRSILDKKARRCPHCEKVYVSMPAYSMHVRTHSQGCECPHCGKCFSRPWLLQGHIRTHTGEKPFKCSICSKAFADKSNLRAHIQTHSNTKPHSCGRCGKSFALKSYLYKHEESSCMRNHTKSDKDRFRSPKMETSKIPSFAASKMLKKQDNNKTCHKNTDEIVEQEIMHEEKVEKSYTTLTSPMSQDDYDRFTRISVIRAPISNQNFESLNNFEMNFYQENPVDFSPKNTFSHSTKTSPFELTNSYTLVA